MNTEKNLIRKKYIKLRNQITFTRRAIAEKKTLEISQLNFKNILSFASKPKEINLWNLNYKLAKEKRLLLPKTIKDSLEIYEVTDIENQLIKGKFNILEPNPEICKKIDYNNISCVLVPGIVFDKHNNRLGYGRGFYDNFLKQIKCPAIGIGFIEQLSSSKLPFENHDIKLSLLFLF